MSIDFHDVERLQTLYPENQIELREGKLIIMSPADDSSAEVGMLFGSLLTIWVYSHNLGRVLESSAGFRFPNGDLLSPDVAFVSRARLKRSTRSFPSVIPELIVEIKSCSDRIRVIEEKIALFLAQGVQVGILIDPDKKTVSVYRHAATTPDDQEEVALPKTTLQNDDILTIPELFPGWEVAISRFWPAVYE